MHIKYYQTRNLEKNKLGDITLTNYLPTDLDQPNNTNGVDYLVAFK